MTDRFKEYGSWELFAYHALTRICIRNIIACKTTLDSIIEAQRNDEKASIIEKLWSKSKALERLKYCARALILISSGIFKLIYELPSKEAFKGDLEDKELEANDVIMEIMDYLDNFFEVI